MLEAHRLTTIDLEEVLAAAQDWRGKLAGIDKIPDRMAQAQRR